MAEGDRGREAAKRAKRGRARQRAAFVDATAADVDRVAVNRSTARVVERQLAPRSGRRRRAAGPAPLAFPNVDVLRWVPIGPSVVRQGQAVGRPRVTGRVRDIAVDPNTGLRMYAATAKGGVWYSRDGGSTWEPFGGWTARTRTAGGTNSAHGCGCLLVAFHNVDEAQDLVMVGTGEPATFVSSVTAAVVGGADNDALEASLPSIHGVGVLTASRPVTRAAATEPWEAESGLAQMENMVIYRLVRDPAAQAGKTANPNRDRVIAATSRGVFLGLRTRVPANGPNPAFDEFRWTAIAPAATPLAGNRVVTDVLWLSGGGADGRVVLAIAGPAATQRVVACTNITDNGTRAFTTIGGVVPDPRTRVSLAHAAADRVYVLGEAGGAPTLWRVPSVAVAAPAGVVVPGTPANLWGTQRDYDQALAVDVVGGTDRVFLGGSVIQPTPGDQWSASLWAFDVQTAPALALVGAPFVSVPGAPNAAGQTGADQIGLIGNNLHGDVHAIRIVTIAGNRHVWVTCDGGIYQSTQAGRVNSFLPRATGLAVIEVGYHTPHPTSSHFGAVGSQDTGSQVRVGDTVWEQTFLADGGGVVFHPRRSQYLIAQNNQGDWRSQPTNGFVSPVRRVQGGGGAAAAYAVENGAAAFYCGADAIAQTATEGRVAIGTNRVWLSDDIGAVLASTWRVIGFPNGPGADQPGSNGVGVPPGALGPVLRLRWVTPTHLLALYQQGIVRYTQAGANWTAAVIIPGAVGAPVFVAGNALFTDIAPVPGTNDFYLTTTGNRVNNLIDTCWFFDSTVVPAGAFVATALRRALDTAPGANDGPRDPAYSAIVDPGQLTDVYIGTVSGVWRGVRPAPANNPHGWTPLLNGLPEAPVQDLAVWSDPGGAANPRLLRAAIQARGLWELDLSAATEPQRTYIRVHERDDRRRIPTPMQNPRRRPGAPPEPFFACPDIVVRPRWPLAAAPRWLLGGGTIDANDRPGYQLWTFQTAFRWHFPSIVADGQWSDQLADLIEQFRLTTGGALAGGGPVVDQPLWNAVVGGTNLNPAGQLVVGAPAATDRLAVYRPPWQHAGAPTAIPTEIDLIETVRPERVQADVWRVHKEQVTVDVLLHHRDSSPLPLGDAFAILLWRDRATQAAALGGNVSAFPAFARSLLTANPLATPGGWNLAVDGAGLTVHRLAHTLDARLPKAVSIDVNLGAVPDWHRVALVVIAGSNTDNLTTPPSGAVNSLEQLVQRWPHAGLRLVQVAPRP